MDLTDMMFEKDTAFTKSCLESLIKNFSSEEVSNLKQNILTTSSGLLAFKHALIKLNDQELQDKGLSFFTMCLKNTKKPNNVDTPLAYKLLGDLFNRCKSLPEIEKIITNQVLTDFFHHSIPKVLPTSYEECLRCLQSILKSYTKQCMSYRQQIEQFLVSFIEIDDDSIVIEAGKCCHLLQVVRPPQGKTTNSKLTWNQQQLTLCSTVHILINALFENTNDVHNYFNETELVSLIGTGSLQRGVLSRITEDGPLNILENTQGISEFSPSQKVLLLSKRLKNILIFLQCMLVEEYPVAKIINTHSLLDMIVRLLNLNIPQTPNTQISIITLVSQIPSIKISALNTLKALIYCLDSNLLPYSSLVTRLIVQTIKWTVENPSPLAVRLRVCCYRILIVWLKVLKCEMMNTEGNSNENLLFDTILEDITPKINTIELKRTSYGSKLSKKAKRKFTKSSIQEGPLSMYVPGYKHAHVDDFGDFNLTLTALECLEQLLLTCGFFFSLNIHKKVKNVLLHQIMQQKICGFNERYDDNHLFLLYKAMEACRISTPTIIPGFDQVCLFIYSTVHTSKKLAKFCSSSLQILRQSLHSVPSSISYDRTQITEALKTPTQFSKRNREALEALLGPTFLKPICSVDLTETINDNEQKVDILPVEDVVNISDDGKSDCEEIDEPSQAKKLKVERGEIINMEVITPDSKIHNVQTQLPHNESKSSDSESSQVFGNVIYDEDNETTTEYVITDTENIPSTNETDDLPISCGQVLKSPITQMESDIGLEMKLTNGTDCKNEEIVITKSDVLVNGDLKIVENDLSYCNIKSELTVEDMMADFVDEIVTVVSDD